MVHIQLRNRSNVDQNAIDDVAAAANMPSGEIRLIAGDPLLPDHKFQALTIPRAHVPFIGSVYGLDQHRDEQWDCGVLIGERWATLQSEYPAFFAFLLGHELGHARTALVDLELSTYEHLVTRDIRRVVPGFSRSDELPHEILYDRFGIAIADELFGRDAVEGEFAAIMKRGLWVDALRIENALRTAPTKDLTSLRHDLAIFSAPYKDQLVATWQEDRDKGRRRILDFLPRFDCLWMVDHGLPSAQP